MTASRVDGRTARWAGHRQQRREAFVEAAVVVIGRTGPSVTVDQIAAELGASRQALYRQFTDRDDLDHAIAERAAGLLVTHLIPVLEVAPPGIAEIDASISRVLLAYLDFVQEHLGLYRFVRSHELEVRTDSAVRLVKDTVAVRVTGLARHVLSDLDLPPEMATTFALGMIGMADAVIERWLDEPRGLTRDQLVEQLTLMLGGAARALTSQRTQDVLTL